MQRHALYAAILASSILTAPALAAPPTMTAGSPSYTESSGTGKMTTTCVTSSTLAAPTISFGAVTADPANDSSYVIVTCKAKPTPTVTVAPISVNEAATSALLTATRAGDLRKASRVTYATGTNGTATAGEDFTAKTGEFYFGANASTATASIVLRPDTKYEGNEIVPVNLTATQNATVSNPLATITILDDDSAPPQPIQCWDGSVVYPPATCPIQPPVNAPNINVDARSCPEQAGPCVVKLWRSGDLSQRSDFTYRTTTNGTATANVDFTPVSGTGSIPAGQQAYSFQFNVNNDTTDEADETVDVAFEPTFNAKFGQVDDMTIVDDDVATPIPPTPGPIVDNLLVSAGDSISVKHAGNYVGTYCASRTTINCTGLAVGGTTLVTMQPQFDQALTLKAEVFTILPGANDLGDTIRYPTVQSYVNYLFSRTDPIRAIGSKIIVGTPLPQQNNPTHNARVPEARNLILAAVGTKIDGAFDLSEPNGPMWSPSNYQDDVHPTYSCGYDCGGQGIIAARYRGPVDTALGFSSSPTPPISGWLPSPSITGFTPIPDNFDTNAALESYVGTIPPSGAPDVVGAFRFICGAGQITNDDSILYPGQPGKSHLHQYYGNVTANANSTYDSLRVAGDSTCNWTGQGFAGNRSAYWMPAMMDGKGNVVRPDEVSIYYKQRPLTDPIVSDPNHPKFMGYGVQLPNGIRFIFGWDPTGLNQIRTGGMWFNCTGPTAVSGHYASLTTALANCPAGQGNKVGGVINAPECWDGKNLDAPDHRSHVSYGSYGTWGYYKCPTTHPYVIPSFTLGAWYTVAAGDDGTKWELSSDPMAPGQPKGYTFHADFFMAWSDPIHQIWFGHCVNKLLNCSGGQLGNGKDLKGAASHNLKRNYLYSTRLVPIPPGMCQMGNCTQP